MAGRHLLRRPGVVHFAVDYRQAKAFCDGMAHRAGGTALERPLTDNPFDTGQEAANRFAWQEGWVHANEAAPGAIDGLSCAVYGLIAT